MPISFRPGTLLLLFMLSACSSDSSPPPDDTPPPEPQPTRSFKMGFTPWLYEASSAAQDFIYEQIQLDGDIISQHIMDGVPWQEAYDQTAYPADVENEITTRLDFMRANTTTYLSIDSLSGDRSQLADNWGASGGEPHSGAWTGRSFDDQEVIDAYVNFALDLIDRFRPKYFNYAVEASVLYEKTSGEWANFLVFAEQVYTRIKDQYPSLNIMVSLSLKTPGSVEMQDLQTNFTALAPYVDMVGISVYPYAFFSHADKGDPETMPDDWLTQIATLAPGKPVAVTETGWPAEDLVIPAYTINVPITASDQLNYTETMLREAGRINAAFVIWFTYADFDTLWNDFPPAAQEVGLIWRDSGLLDQTLNSRPALQNWQSWFDRRYLP